MYKKYYGYGCERLMNAELWSYPDPKSVRITLTCWLREHNIPYSDDMDNEELRQLYIDVETGRYPYK